MLGCDICDLISFTTRTIIKSFYMLTPPTESNNLSFGSYP